MDLFNFFRRKTKHPASNKQITMDSDSLFFHEDDFCQIELIPIDNIDNLTSELDKINEFSEKHSDGIGYTDIYIRNKSNYPLRDKEINFVELIEILDDLNVQKYSKVYTGYGSSYRIISEDTIGYGDGYSAIYFDFKENIVQNIWLTNPWKLNKENFAAVLHEIGLRWNLVLVDWDSNIMINLSNLLSIKEYLRFNEE